MNILTVLAVRIYCRYPHHHLYPPIRGRVAGAAAQVLFILSLYILFLLLLTNVLKKKPLWIKCLLNALNVNVNVCLLYLCIGRIVECVERVRV